MSGATVVGRVWWCGDTMCDCTYAVIERVTPNPSFPRFVIRESLWEGSFYSGEPSKAFDELSAIRRALEVAWPDNEIEWYDR